MIQSYKTFLTLKEDFIFKPNIINFQILKTSCHFTHIKFSANSGWQNASDIWFKCSKSGRKRTGVNLKWNLFIVIMGCFVDMYLDTACRESTWGFLNLPTGGESSHPSLLTFGASKQAGQFSGMTGKSLLSANWRRDFSRTYTKGRITRRSRSLQGNAILVIELNSNLFSQMLSSITHNLSQHSASFFMVLLWLTTCNVPVTWWVDGLP